MQVGDDDKMKHFWTERMKTIVVNLSEWMNTPNEELEEMMGISWMQFHDLLNAIEGDDEDE